MKYDVVSVGDSTVDYFLKIHDAEVKCDINEEECQICLHYADKIPVDQLVRVPLAGNAANFAVGSSRLGLKSALYTNVGDDLSGRGMVEHLKDEGVSDEFITVQKGKESNFSTVINFRAERTILVYHTPWEYKQPDLDTQKTSWLYYTSIAPHHEPMHGFVTNAKKSGIKIGFNPGTYQLNEGLGQQKHAIAVSEVFVVNKDEANKLLGTEEADIKRLITALHKYGAKYTVITDGQKGSWATDGKLVWECPMFPGPRMEATGAGDSYATGLIVALILGKDLPEAMVWGSINAASVVGKIGPQAGLLTMPELTKRRESRPDYKAHTI
jgi:sugar/nucleoside kinase (ribokinase family)